jgi:hypothetical protein
MAKKRKNRTVATYTRLHQADFDELNRAAAEELTTRSTMIARVIREWVKRRHEGGGSRK